MSDTTGQKASAPIRKAEPYAGPNEGMHFPLRKGADVLLSFIDGDPEATRGLLRHTVGLYAGTEIAAMIPVASGEAAAVGPLVDEFSFKTWSDGTADVYVYELALDEFSSARRS